MPSSQFVKSSVVTISNGASISADSKYTRVFNMTHLIPYEVYMSEPPKSSEDGTTTYNWALKQRRGHSALYAGIHSLDKDWDSYYVGFVGQISDAEDKPIEQSCYTEELKKSVECFLLEKKVVPVFLEDELHHGHYEGFCKTGT